MKNSIKLAMIKEENTAELVKAVEEIIKMAEILRDIDGEEQESESVMPLREDVSEAEFSREEMLSNAPLVKDGYIAATGGIA